MKIMVYYLDVSETADPSALLNAKKEELQKEFPHLRIMVLATKLSRGDHIDVIDMTPTQVAYPTTTNVPFVYTNPPYTPNPNPYYYVISNTSPYIVTTMGGVGAAQQNGGVSLNDLPLGSSAK